MALIIAGSLAGMETIEGTLRTPDGYWRIEVVRYGRRDIWYRIRHATTVVQEKASLGTVQRILGEAYATLEPATGENDAA